MALLGGLTDYGERHLLGHLLGTTTYAAPDLWLALGSTQWQEDGTGGTEVTGGGYARVKVDAWDPVTVEVIVGPSFIEQPRARTRNSTPILFPVSTGAWTPAGPMWGAFFDAPTGGNAIVLVASGPTLPGDVVNAASKQLYFDAGSLEIFLTARYYFDSFAGAYYTRGSLYKTWIGHLLKHFMGEATMPARNLHFALTTSGGIAETAPIVERSDSWYARVSCDGKWTAPATDTDSRASSTVTEDRAFPNATAEVTGTGSLNLVNGATGSDWVALFGYSSVHLNSGDRLVIRPDDLYMLLSS